MRYEVAFCQHSYNYKLSLHLAHPSIAPSISYDRDAAIGVM